MNTPDRPAGRRRPANGWTSSIDTVRDRDAVTCVLAGCSVGTSSTAPPSSTPAPIQRRARERAGDCSRVAVRVGGHLAERGGIDAAHGHPHRHGRSRGHARRSGDHDVRGRADQAHGRVDHGPPDLRDIRGRSRQHRRASSPGSSTWRSSRRGHGTRYGVTTHAGAADALPPRDGGCRRGGHVGRPSRRASTAGLDGQDVVGLMLWPIDLRHFVSFKQAVSWTRRTSLAERVRIIGSTINQQVVTTLGGTPVGEYGDGVDWRRVGVRSRVQPARAGDVHGQRDALSAGRPAVHQPVDSFDGLSPDTADGDA